MSKNKQAQYGDAKSITLDEDRTLRVVVTAPTLDRDLEVLDTKTARVPIKPVGWKYAADLTLDDEVDVPFILDHSQYDGIQKMAGSVKRMVINESGELEALVGLSTVDNGERVYTLAKEGHLGNSFSIGFTYQNATDDGESIKNYEILELSAVFKGSNRNARIVEVKSAGGSMTELEKKKAELEALQAEIAEAEKAEAVEVAEVTEVAEEVAEVEAPAEVETEEVEAEVETTEEVEEETVEEVTEPQEETKAVKKEKSMADAKDHAVAEIETKAVAPSQEFVETKSISRNEAKKMIVEILGKAYSGDTEGAEALAQEAKGTKVINGTTGSPLYVEEIFTGDIYDAYSVYGRVGGLVTREDIEGAETLKVLVETAGTGFQPVALGAAKSEDQPVWTPVIFEPFEWALIVAWLDGVQKRTPVAIYNQIVRYIAKEYAKLEDKIILTYAGGTVGTETRPATGLVPILTTAGRVTPVASYNSADLVPALGAAYGNIESDDVLTLVANRKTWAKLATSLDANDNPIFTVVGEQVAAGALGTFRVVQSNALADDVAVLGGFADYHLVTRGQLGTLFSREATVGSLNLFTQDASALRADIDITGKPVLNTSFQLLDFGTSS